MLFLGVLVLVLLAAAVGGFLFYRGRRSLPQTEGAVQLRGLTAPVEVSRDSWGIPHLYGQDVLDLARAMGYVHAQDRLFQMEILRRSGGGRLAELFGSAALDQDRLARRLGLAQAAAAELGRMAPLGREVLEAYASGVNAYRETAAGRLPPEYTLLDHEPRPWEAVDSLTIAKWMSHVLSFNAKVEMLRSNLVEVVGLEAAYVLTGLEPPPVEEDASRSARDGFRIARLDREPPPLWRTAPGASNAWVVSGERSSSGRPLLASDPHLPLSMPSIWYEIHLYGGEIDVAGASLPGLPLVLIGQNRRIAWGITALFADVQDLYLERLHPDNPRQYAFGEAWVDLDIVQESIPVKDGSPVSEEVRVSRHGVIVGETSDGRLLAQRWDALWRGDHVLALLRLNQAGSWQEFTDALRTWASPPVSFVYADVEGNIGFFPAGEIPVRVGFDGTLPVDGSALDREWQGSIPHELKPMRFNPEEGVIVSANQQMLDPETPYPLGRDTLASYRADRIRSLLNGARSASLDDFARIQEDRYDESTAALLRHVVKLAPSSDEMSRAIDILRSWTGYMTGGPAPAIYQALYLRLLENTFRDELGDPLFDDFLEFLELGYPGGLAAILDDEASPFWDHRESPEVEDRTAILAKSLEEAIGQLSQRYGTAMETWDWGLVHGVRFQHPLGREESLNWLFSRGPIPFGGSTFTVANAVVSLREPFETTAGTSFRFLADLADLTRSRSVVPTGASGHPLSPHYFDQNGVWLEGGSHALLVDRSAIEGAAEAKLILQP